MKEKWHKRTEVLCFAVNDKTRRIEKIYANRKCCSNYTMKKDYPISCYYIYHDSKNYEVAQSLLVGEIFPTNLTF